MAKSMTQEELTKLLQDRGWDVTDMRNAVEWKKEQCGLSIHAISLTGYLLSIQGGMGLYSDPRHKADSYTEVEFAIWKVGANGQQDSKFIRDSQIKDTNDDVYGYETFDVLMRAVEMIESWKDGHEPDLGIISRDDAPYRDLN